MIKLNICNENKLFHLHPYHSSLRTIHTRDSFHMHIQVFLLPQFSTPHHTLSALSSHIYLQILQHSTPYYSLFPYALTSLTPTTHNTIPHATQHFSYTLITPYYSLSLYTVTGILCPPNTLFPTIKFIHHHFSYAFTSRKPSLHHF